MNCAPGKDGRPNDQRREVVGRGNQKQSRAREDLEPARTPSCDRSPKSLIEETEEDEGERDAEQIRDAARRDEFRERLPLDEDRRPDDGRPSRDESLEEENRSNEQRGKGNRAEKLKRCDRPNERH